MNDNPNILGVGVTIGTGTSDFNIIAKHFELAETLNLERKDRCINIMPLFHIHGIVCSLLTPLFSGGSVFPSPGFNTLKFFLWLQEFSPTWYSAVPTMHQAIISRSDRNLEIIAKT